MDERYSSSLGPKSDPSFLVSSVTKSKMLLRNSAWRARACGLSATPFPKRRSNSARGKLNCMSGFLEVWEGDHADLRVHPDRGCSGALPGNTGPGRSTTYLDPDRAYRSDPY